MPGIKKVNNYELIVSEDIRESMIKDYVENLLSIRDLSSKYGITSKTFIAKVLGDKKRSVSEAKMVAHKRHPEAFKHSEETKALIREKRLKFMKEHPEKQRGDKRTYHIPNNVSSTCFPIMILIKSILYTENTQSSHISLILLL